MSLSTENPDETSQQTNDASITGVSNVNGGKEEAGADTTNESTDENSSQQDDKENRHAADAPDEQEPLPRKLHAIKDGSYAGERKGTDQEGEET